MIQVFFFQAKKLCAEVIQTYFCIESISKNIWWHMRTTNLGMMYIFVSHALFLRPTIDRFEIGLVWKWAYMLWKWQHLAILQKWYDLNLLGKYFYATYLYSILEIVMNEMRKLKMSADLFANTSYNICRCPRVYRVIVYWLDVICYWVSQGPSGGQSGNTFLANVKNY